MHLPPLRDRRDDIPLLVDAFLERAAEQRGTERKHITPEAMEALRTYSWPGNVRELENALERAVILTTGDTLEVSVFPERVGEHEPERLVDVHSAPNPTLETIEKAYILWVLQSEQGNKTRAA